MALKRAQAVGLVLGEGLLVAVDDLVGVVVEVAEGDEAAALADFVGVGDGVGLGVAVEGGLGFFGEDVLAAPGAQGVGGAGVDVCSLQSGVGRGNVLAEDDADEVVGAGLVVALLHGGGDLVVGLGDDVFHVDAGRGRSGGRGRDRCGPCGSRISEAEVMRDCTVWV